MGDLTPEELQVMMEMIMQGQTAGAEQDILKRQFEQADAMRGPASLEMHGGGRMQRAPHWLELLGGLGQEAASGKMKQKAEKGQRDLSEKTAVQNQRLLEILMRQTAQPPQVTPAQPGQPSGINLNAPQGLGIKPGMNSPFGV